MSDDLSELSKAELYDLAAARGIEGRGDMTKAQLLEALGGAEPEEPAEAPESPPEAPESASAPAFGDRGPEVRAVQDALVERGFRLDRNGIFDAKTAAALRSFQSVEGLAVSGEIDSATAEALAADG